MKQKHNFYRNQDDTFTDPYLIAARYVVGKNAFFEVSLALAELEDLGGRDNTGANSSNLGGGLLDSLLIDTDIDSLPCPEENEYVWVKGDNQMPISIRAKELLSNSRVWELYNPISRSFNSLSKAEYVENVDLGTLVTGSGCVNIVSTSHKVIKNTIDKMGTSLNRYRVGDELLRFNPLDGNIYADDFVGFEKIGRGNVVKISLEAEFIYAIGHTKEMGILAHNRKPLEDVETGF